MLVIYLPCRPGLQARFTVSIPAFLILPIDSLNLASPYKMQTIDSEAPLRRVVTNTLRVTTVTLRGQFWRLMLTLRAQSCVLAYRTRVDFHGLLPRLRSRFL